MTHRWRRTMSGDQRRMSQAAHDAGDRAVNRCRRAMLRGWPHRTTRGRSAEDVLDLIEDGADLIVPLANGEPVAVLDAIEAHATRWSGRTRPPDARPPRSALPARDHARAPPPRVVLPLAGHSPRVPRSGGASSCRTTSARCLGCSGRPLGARWSWLLPPLWTGTGTSRSGRTATTSRPFIGQVPFFLEVNAQMPRTFGRNQIHVSQVAGWAEVDRPLVEVAAREPSTVDERIAELRRRTDPRRSDDPGRHRLDPQRAARGASSITATSASTPSCFRTR